MKQIPFSSKWTHLVAAAFLAVAGPLWAADPCVIPGVQVLSDGADDQSGAASGQSKQYDIRELSIAELGTAPGARKLVFTLKVAELGSLPPNGSWQVFFDTSDGVASRYVEMVTNEAGEVSFNYGRPDATTGALTSEGAADAESTYGADGAIRIVASVDKIGIPAPGGALQNVNAKARMLGGASLVGGAYITFDETSKGSYTLAAAGLCPELAGGGGGSGGSGGGTVQSGGPRFTVYNPPRESFRDGVFNALEPTLGINYKSGNVFMVYDLNILRTAFDHSHSPAQASWDDVTSSLTANTADPFLTVGTPFASNGRPATTVPSRVLEVQLNGPNSSMAYSDDDGASWLPSQGGGQPHGADNQSAFSGPYPAGKKPATASVNYALYYCSHGIVNAFCSRSDDGGVIWNPSRAIFPLGCSNHGHVKVGADGTVYVPMNNSCDGAEGVSISVDAGETWHYLKVPDTAHGRWDSSIAIASDGKTVYYGYGEEGVDRPMVIKGVLNKSDPANPRIDWDPAGAVDVGVPANLKNMVFATVVAGDPDRAAMVFHGTTRAGDSGDHVAMGANGNDPAEWHLYAATTYDGGSNWSLRDITPADPTQRGAICDAGTACATETGRPSDRNLLDFMGAVIDAEGRIVAGFADGCIGNCVPLGGAPTYSNRGGLAVQTGGKRMYAEFDADVPAQPLSPWLSASRDGRGVSLNWQHPDQGDAPIQGYRVYRQIDGGSESQLAQLGYVTEYLDSSALDPERSYSYRVAAFNTHGESAKSNVASAATTAAGDVCTLPGVVALSDPEGDATTGAAAVPGLPQADITSLSVAEPKALAGKLVITLKVSNLTAVPQGHRWVAYFDRGDGAVFFAAMVTTDTPTPEFVYGTAGADDLPQASFRTYEIEGKLDAASGYNADGTVSLVIDKASFGSPAPGTLLTKLFGQTRSSTPEAGDGRGLTADNTGEADYRLRAADACDEPVVNTAPLAALQATPITGTAPLTVNFDASGSSDADSDAIVEYRFTFGDGATQTSSSSTASHEYANPGTYGATVAVKDARGALSTNHPLAQIVVDDAGNTTGGSTGGTTGGSTENDTDGDGIDNDTDNCPTVSNADQANVDHDEAGDACDSVNNADPDNDGVNDPDDNCPTTANPDQDNADQDEAGDACDSVNSADPDNDGLANSADNCPNVANPDQADADGDDIGDACDAASNNGPNGDNDGDSVVNGTDNCPAAPNGAQGDTDGDGAGDVCDSVNNSDQDGDGKPNASDNCPAAPNAGQTDSDGDGAGDVCDNTNHIDSDGDGTPAADDNCPNNANPGQEDVDGDGKGDACDPVNDLDDDGDGVADGADNCPAVPNRGQADGDGDGVGDHCDATFNDDTDGDSIVNGSDNCPSVPNSNQRNQDNDRYGDACDADQGNGGGTAKVNRASAEPIAADAGSGIRVGDLVLKNISSRKHRVESIQLKLTNPQNIARIYGTVDGVRFNCAPAQPAAINTCVADAVLELQPGQQLTVDIWVELTQATAKLQLTAIDLSTSGGGLMLIGTVGLGLGRRRYRAAALIAAALLLSACGDKGSSGSEVDPKLSTVTLEAVEVRDDLNAPVDYGLPVKGTEVGTVSAK